MQPLRFSDPRRVNHQTIIFSPNEVNGNITEWVKDKRRGGSGQKAEEEERKMLKEEKGVRRESAG